VGQPPKKKKKKTKKKKPQTRPSQKKKNLKKKQNPFPKKKKTQQRRGKGATLGESGVRRTREEGLGGRKRNSNLWAGEKERSRVNFILGYEEKGNSIRKNIKS